MYLQLGNNAVVRKSEILAIFDLDNTSQSRLTREYLAEAEKAGSVVNAAGAELPKSFVVCAAPHGGQRVYLCQFNSSTLSKRSETPGIE